MKTLTSIAVSLISGALFFFTIPEGNILEIGNRGVLFSLVFGLFFSSPFMLFCTLPASLIIEYIAN
ncbi:hypothetical protein [Bacillus sp. NEB1478]|uniref:hypothetical protein n=1 Tax=Bacillus sp. NEB1478 TaxID=3073816 RepID=UPI00287322B9|nr:hypothetical protein [Bacillus sp. NEB1478]WNB91150.1 hypothetical protein RGB74_14730 [Bacillus sp. NEB1478]